MDIKNLVGERVIHQSFGEGVIEDVHDKYLGIDFPECNRKSEFVYPSCFDIFLRLKKIDIQNDIASDLEQWRVESGAVRKEELKQQYEKTQRAIRERQIAAREKKEKKAILYTDRLHGKKYR